MIFLIKKPFLHDRDGFFLYTVSMNSRQKIIPEIIRADILGYCMGVRKAVEMAKLALEEHKSCQVWTLGPLIHNQIALDMLANQGIKVLSDSQIKNLQEKDIVVIRAHGVPPQKIEEIKSHGSSVIDATCPLVRASQKRAAKYTSLGYTVFLAGDKNHGEITGIVGYAEEAARENGRCFVIENRKEAEDVIGFIEPSVKAVLISQTTFSPMEFDAIAEILQKKIPTLEVMNTICPATMERQKALADLKGKADGVLIIGGKNSANTRRLLLYAQKYFSIATLIETADEIPPEFFSLKKIALTAGASTPDEVIEEVERVLISKK